jgi:hypothetical protein
MGFFTGEDRVNEFTIVAAILFALAMGAMADSCSNADHACTLEAP